jgi:Ca2+-binding EF-hand superfamily protein
MMRQCYPNADTDKLEKHIFRMYDANHDGKIDFK